MLTLGSPIFGHDYLDLLKNTDLSKSFFVGAQNDRAVGDWTNEELDFLNKKAGLVYFGEGGHSAVFNYKAMKAVQKFLIGKHDQ